MDLQIAQGQVTALVSGSELYKIQIQIKPLARAHWKRVQTECAGKIDSLIESEVENKGPNPAKDPATDASIHRV